MYGKVKSSSDLHRRLADAALAMWSVVSCGVGRRAAELKEAGRAAESEQMLNHLGKAVRKVLPGAPVQPFSSLDEYASRFPTDVEVIEFIKRLLWNAGFDYRLHCFSFFAGLCMVAEERSMDEPLPNATLAELHRTWDASIPLLNDCKELLEAFDDAVREGTLEIDDVWEFVVALADRMDTLAGSSCPAER